ncbi:MAG: hypothetical protein ACFNTA_01805 [Campylobacter sp.]|uniref:hypothetical protein n=1 Tax=Campylobacter sp. TaxID=205 RepID=UPI00361FC8BA
MNAKFQAEMKELDEKFAVIPEDEKRRYDRHRFIRRAIMTYWLSAFVASDIFSMLASYLESFFISNDIELPPEIFSYIRGFMEIALPVCATIYVLRRSKTKRYSYLFVRDQRASFLAFRIENFASIVLILYPILLIIGSFFSGGSSGYGIYAFLYGLVAAPICLLIFAVCYSLNISSYEPAPERADLRRESGLAQSAKSTEEKLDELNDLDAEFDQIPWGLKNRYDAHRLIRRASMAFIGFTLMVSWFAGFIGNILGVAYLAVVLILPYIFTKIYLKSYPTKKYSKFFIKNQRLCLTIFTVENLASIALILYPLVLIIAALIARNDEKTMNLLLGGSNVLSACLVIFAACYLFNRSTYISKDEA